MKKIPNIPNTWDECKTKEQKDAFIKELDRIDKTSKFISFDDYIFKSYMKELSK